MSRVVESQCRVAGDNRFEIIEKAKEHMLAVTNISDCKDEMECLDSFLFRCWQMGWLHMYEEDVEKTDKIDGSNFSEKQYNADLQCAYDCGYNRGYVDATEDIADWE